MSRNRKTGFALIGVMLMLLSAFAALGTSGGVASSNSHFNPATGCTYPTIVNAGTGGGAPFSALFATTAGDILLVWTTATLYNSGQIAVGALSDGGVDTWTLLAQHLTVGIFGGEVSNSTLWTATAAATGPQTFTQADGSQWQSIVFLEIHPVGGDVLTFGQFANTSATPSLTTSASSGLCSGLFFLSSNLYDGGTLATALSPPAGWTSQASASFGGGSVAGGVFNNTTATAGVSTATITGGPKFGGGVMAVYGQAPASNPTAPAGLTATPISTTEIDLAWTNPSGESLTDSHVYQSVGAGCTSPTQINLASVVTSYAATGLASNTLFSFEVTANNMTGESPYSACVSATTMGGVATAPTGLTATVISSTEIDLAWTNPIGESLTDNHVYYQVGAGCGALSSIDLGAVQTAYSKTGLTISTLYSFETTASNATGESVGSNCASATTLSANAPGTPANVTGTPYGYFGLTINWTAPVDTGSGITNYTLEWGTTHTGPYPNVVSVGTGIAHLIRGLNPSTQYYFIVQAWSTVAHSSFSVEVGATTATDPLGHPIIGHTTNSTTGVSTNNLDVQNVGDGLILFINDFSQGNILPLIVDSMANNWTLVTKDLQGDTIFNTTAVANGLDSITVFDKNQFGVSTDVAWVAVDVLGSSFIEQSGYLYGSSAITPTYPANVSTLFLGGQWLDTHSNAVPSTGGTAWIVRTGLSEATTGSAPAVNVLGQNATVHQQMPLSFNNTGGDPVGVAYVALGLNVVLPTLSISPLLTGTVNHPHTLISPSYANTTCPISTNPLSGVCFAGTPYLIVTTEVGFTIEFEAPGLVHDSGGPYVFNWSDNGVQFASVSTAHNYSFVNRTFTSPYTNTIQVNVTDNTSFEHAFEVIKVMVSPAPKVVIFYTLSLFGNWVLTVSVYRTGGYDLGIYTENLTLNLTGPGPLHTYQFNMSQLINGKAIVFHLNVSGTYNMTAWGVDSLNVAASSTTVMVNTTAAGSIPCFSCANGGGSAPWPIALIVLGVIGILIAVVAYSALVGRDNRKWR